MATNPFGKEPTLPAIPDVRSTPASEVLRALKEWVDVRQGMRGDKLDRAVTLRDLLNAGVAEPGAIKNLYPEAGEGIPLIPGGTEDAATPPTPTNLVAAGAYSTIILTWDFSRGYTRHAYFEVWRSDTDALADAVLIAQVYEPMYSDDVGPGNKYYYWVRAVSDSGVSSFNAVSGTLGETALNIEEVLDTLEGAITEDFLHQSLAERIDTTELLAQENDAAIQAETEARADADAAIASSVTTLAARVGNAETALQTEASVRAQADGQLFAQYTVKIDTGGYVAGFGLASTTSAAGSTTSTFAVRADRFYIAAPALPSNERTSIPFIVQTTSTTLNGVTVPRGVYMRDAYIMNGSIVNAKIANLAVDNAKISSLSVTKLTAGKLSVGAYIESTNYSSGRTGFIIHANGNAEFNNATVRGTVYANAGEIGGIRIEARRIQTTNYNGSNAGWRINSDGSVHFTNGTFRGAITATSGTFSGSLNAATGTFSGSLNAATGTFTGRVHGGYFTAGAFTGPNWPYGTGTGVYLGPGGLLLGNYHTGRWFEVRADGSYLAMPGLYVQNGVLNIHQANVIDTLQLRGGAVSTTHAVSFNGPTSIWLNTPVATTAIVIIYARVTTTMLHQKVGSASAWVSSRSVARSQTFFFPIGSTGGDDDVTTYSSDATTGVGSTTVPAGGAMLSIEADNFQYRIQSGNAIVFMLKR